MRWGAGYCTWEIGGRRRRPLRLRAYEHKGRLRKQGLNDIGDPKGDIHSPILEDTRPHLPTMPTHLRPCNMRALKRGASARSVHTCRGTQASRISRVHQSADAEMTYASATTLSRPPFASCRAGGTTRRVPRSPAHLLWRGSHERRANS